MINLDNSIIIKDILPIFLIENIRRNNDYYDNNMNGWGRGYVGLPNYHPYFGLKYDDLNFLSVHGYITYSGLVNELWIIGFDTNHYGDNLENCNFKYVYSETIKLKNQCMSNKDFQRIIKLNKINNLVLNNI